MLGHQQTNVKLLLIVMTWIKKILMYSIKIWLKKSFIYDMVLYPIT